MNSFFSELKRRNVFRVGIAYVVVSWVILQFVDVVDDILSLPEWFGKAVLVLVAIGFPFALLFSWAYEVTLEGVKKTHEVDKSKSITHGTGQKINKLIAVGFVKALGFIAYDKMIATDDPVIEEAKAGQVSIAVLPFSDLSPDGDQEYFSDGISEEILNVLVRVDGLVVASRTSSFAFKGQASNIPEIARELGVDHILEGSVRKAGNRVRITAQLIDTATDRHLWSETYDRELTDIFEIQDEISNAIVVALKGPLGVGEAPVSYQAGTENIEAYQRYLQGRHFFFLRGEANLLAAIEHFKEAVVLDPGFARAWADLAATYSITGSYTEKMTNDFYFPLAVEAADEAIRLDPTLAVAWVVKGGFEELNKRWEEGRELQERAVQLDPKSESSWLWLGIHYAIGGHLDEARQALETAYEISPATAINQFYLGTFLFYQGDLEKGGNFAKRAGQGGFPDGWILLGEIEMEKGNFEAAQPLLQSGFEGLGMRTDLIPFYIEAIQNPDKKDAAIEALKAPFMEAGVFQSDGTVFYLYVADLLAQLGEYDPLIGAFQNMFGAIDFGTVVWRPGLKGFRNSEAFKTYAKDVGLVAFWQTHGWPDMCRPLGDKDFECD